MFQKQYRFPAQNQLDHPKTIFSHSFTLKFAPNKLPISRFGFAVSKKISKKATIRNQIKRRFRSCLEVLHSQINQGYDFLFIPRPISASKTKKEFIQEIESILSKNNLYKTNKT